MTFRASEILVFAVVAFAFLTFYEVAIFDRSNYARTTTIIGGQLIRIGKIILMEVMKFIEDNPNLATGVTIGAAVGALAGFVPFFGPILAPLVSAVAALLGGLAGARLDRSQTPSQGFVGIAQEVIIVSRKFFELLVSIFMALKNKMKDH